MIVCQCGVVSDRDVSAAVRSGAGSLRAVCQTTSAGQDCGGCVFALKRLVCQHVAEQYEPVVEVQGAAS